MENQNNAAQVVTDIGLPELRDVLKAACLSGEHVTLSYLAAGALYFAMTTPPAPQLGNVRHPVLDAGATNELLGALKAEAQAKAADGANWSMEVGCMFVLAMIERIEASTDQPPVGFIDRKDLPKLGNCPAELWARPGTTDAVPLFFGAAAGSAA